MIHVVACLLWPTCTSCRLCPIRLCVSRPSWICPSCLIRSYVSCHPSCSIRFCKICPSCWIRSYVSCRPSCWTRSCWTRSCWIRFCWIRFCMIRFCMIRRSCLIHSCVSYRPFCLIHSCVSCRPYLIRFGCCRREMNRCHRSRCRSPSRTSCQARYGLRGV